MYKRQVDGYIEAIYPYDDPVALICGEEAKLEGKPLNLSLIHISVPICPRWGNDPERACRFPPCAVQANLFPAFSRQAREGVAPAGKSPGTWRVGRSDTAAQAAAARERTAKKKIDKRRQELVDLWNIATL